MLSAADRERAMKLLFGADGARFTSAGSRSAPATTRSNRYTLDDDAPGDTAMAKLLDRPRHEGADPVHQGGAGDQIGHPLVGQPVDAAAWMKTKQRATTAAT